MFSPKLSDCEMASNIPLLANSSAFSSDNENISCFPVCASIWLISINLEYRFLKLYPSFTNSRFGIGVGDLHAFA